MNDIDKIRKNESISGAKWIGLGITLCAAISFGIEVFSKDEITPFAIISALNIVIGLLLFSQFYQSGINKQLVIEIDRLKKELSSKSDSIK